MAHLVTQITLITEVPEDKEDDVSVEFIEEYDDDVKEFLEGEVDSTTTIAVRTHLVGVKDE